MDPGRTEDLVPRHGSRRNPGGLPLGPEWRAPSWPKRMPAAKSRSLASKGAFAELYRALQTDPKRSTWKTLWGRSINFDELANGVIVHPAIIAALGERFGNRSQMILMNFRAEKSMGSQPSRRSANPS